MADHAYELNDLPRPVGRTRALQRLTRSLDALVASNSDPSTVAGRAGMLLQPALADPLLLEPRHCESWEGRYRPHLVHVHPAGRYSVVGLVWNPGQATAIHDHRCWCVVGVWRGLERETSYDLHDDEDGEPYLVHRTSSVASRGEVAVLVPPDEDIHRVENAGEGVAISVHVYGDDIARLGSSINREFADDLVRECAVPWSEPVSWRTLDERY